MSEHVATITQIHGHRRAVCTCGRKWANVSYDGHDGNRQSNELVAHLREHGGTYKSLAIDVTFRPAPA